MIQLQGDGQSGLGAAPKIAGNNIPNIQPDIVGGMSVANNFNPAKPFMDMQQAIVEARIKQEALAQQKAQSERSLAMQEAKMNQDESQFQQSMQLDQKKLQQQAEQAQITQKINNERLQLDKMKQDMEMQDWTDKKVSQQFLQQNPDVASEVFTNPDKYDPETVSKVKSAIMVADPKSYWSFITEKYKEDSKNQISQKQLASLQATVPMLAEASDKSVELARLGKSPTEALKPITEALNKGINEGTLDYDTAKELLKLYSDSKKEVVKQYKKLQGDGGSATYYIDGKPVDQATAAANPNKVTQFSPNGLMKAPKVEKKSLIEQLQETAKMQKAKKGSK